MSNGKPPSKQQQILASVTRLETVVIGVPDTDDRGMAGEIKAIRKHLADLNGQVKTNTMFRKVGTWISCSLFIAIIGLLVKVFTSLS